MLPIIAIVTALVAAVSIAQMQPRRRTNTPPAPPPASQYGSTIAAVGLVEPSSENVRIGTPLSAIVENVLVQAGDEVAAGAPLFRLETRHLDAALADAQSAVAVARAGVAVAEAAHADVSQQLALALAVADRRAISEDELERRRHAAGTAKARLEESRALVEAAEAERQRIQVDLDRSVVRAPIAGTVLKVNVRPGEYAAAAPLAEPLIILGNVDPLFVRVDVDEHAAAQIRASASATGTVRGDATIRTPLSFVRFEPLVIPKRALTGDSAERVDTRVLQVIYRVENDDVPLFIGQQLDVFIDAAAAGGAGV
jgi:HlyD family secretion protein